MINQKIRQKTNKPKTLRDKHTRLTTVVAVATTAAATTTTTAATSLGTLPGNMSLLKKKLKLEGGSSSPLTSENFSLAIELTSLQL